MAVKITQMVAKAGELSGDEMLEIADGSTTRRISVSQIIASVDVSHTVTSRAIDLSVPSDQQEVRKIIIGDNQNIVRLVGNCAIPSVYFHDDVLAVDNFRVTVVIPENADNEAGGDGYHFHVIYWDGSTSQTIWRIPSRDAEQIRDLAYDILISQGEIIVVGQTDSNV